MPTLCYGEIEEIRDEYRSNSKSAKQLLLEYYGKETVDEVEQEARDEGKINAELDEAYEDAFFHLFMSDALDNGDFITDFFYDWLTSQKGLKNATLTKYLAA